MGDFIIDKKKIHINLARLKFEGENFEIDIDPDLAIAFRQGKLSDVSQAIKAQHIFKDAKKGLLASEHELQRIFGTSDALKVAGDIIRKGEIQLSAEHRQRMREQKRNYIINVIQRNAVDPRTHLPHPVQRIESAFEEAKVRIDDIKPADEQVDDVVKQLRPILPLKFEVKEIEVKIPAEFAARSYSLVKGVAKILGEEWLNDGSLRFEVEVPAGLEVDFYDKVNKFTHGNNEIKVVKVK